MEIQIGYIKIHKRHEKSKCYKSLGFLTWNVTNVLCLESTDNLRIFESIISKLLKAWIIISNIPTKLHKAIKLFKILEYLSNFLKRFKCDKNLTNLETFYRVKISKFWKSHEQKLDHPKRFSFFFLNLEKQKENHKTLKLKNYWTLNCCNFKKKYNIINLHSKAYNFYFFTSTLFSRYIFLQRFKDRQLFSNRKFID